jgi:PAS domain S-box-containing protein
MTNLENIINQVVENSRIEFYLVNDEDLKFFYANKAAQENIGYSLDELSHMTPMDINAIHDYKQIAELSRPLQTSTEAIVGFNNVYRRKDGSTYQAHKSSRNSRETTNSSM